MKETVPVVWYYADLKNIISKNTIQPCCIWVEAEISMYKNLDKRPPASLKQWKKSNI